MDRDGGDAFQRDNIFPTASEILEKLTDEEQEIIPEHKQLFQRIPTMITASSMVMF